MRTSAVFALMTILATGDAFAEAVPAGSRLDARVRETRYVDGQVFVVQTSLTRATTIEFEPGERIVSVVAGDTSSFQFQTIPGDRVVAIKPTSRGARTNATIYTDRRSYYFTLQEGQAPFYVVRFTYPRSSNPAAQPVLRGPDNFNYGVSEQNEITPMSVWDDGTFTYFRFRPGAPVPSIFAVRNGRERSVNSSIVEDRVVRVSGTSLQWVVRLGNLEVCIVELF